MEEKKLLLFFLILASIIIKMKSTETESLLNEVKGEGLIRAFQ
jgi:hypothetical protein